MKSVRSATGPEVGGFLKARRADLSPGDVGLPDTGSLRRVPGLRREEVAQLAAMSVEYYTRIEQGRLQPSAAILGVLARVLRLDEDQKSYLFQLSGKRPEATRRRPVQRVTPAMKRLLEQLTDTPAMVLGRRLDILGWNRSAAALFVDFERIPAQHRNYVRLLFMDPTFRALHADWENAACTAVASLRMEAASYPDDTQLADLVSQLSVGDVQFRPWWEAQRVTSAGGGRKHYRHGLVGELSLDCDTWVSPEDPDQRILILTAEHGSPSHERLSLLTAWGTVDVPSAR